MSRSRIRPGRPDVAVSPGLGFGEYGDGFVRIALVENEHRIRQAARNLKGHGLSEGTSTRLVVYAAQLILRGIAPRAACRTAMVRPITDDADIRETLDHAIDAIFA